MFYHSLLIYWALAPDLVLAWVTHIRCVEWQSVGWCWSEERRETLRWLRRSGPGQQVGLIWGDVLAVWVFTLGNWVGLCSGYKVLVRFIQLLGLGWLDQLYKITRHCGGEAVTAVFKFRHGFPTHGGVRADDGTDYPDPGERREGSERVTQFTAQPILLYQSTLYRAGQLSAVFG